MAPAPGLFSMMTGLPRRLETASAAARAIRSLAPPGPKGTTHLIAWSGQSAWAEPAWRAAAIGTSAAPIISRKRRAFIRWFPEFRGERAASARSPSVVARQNARERIRLTHQVERIRPPRPLREVD